MGLSKDEVAWNQQTEWFLEGVTCMEGDGQVIVRNMVAWQAKPAQFRCLMSNCAMLRKYNKMAGDTNRYGEQEWPLDYK